MSDSRDKTLLQFFGKRLRTARRAANLSQQGLAKRLGLGQDTISHYEQAKSMPGIVIVFELAQALCVDVRYFFPDDGLSHLAEEERETLALLSSLSPTAYQFVLSFVRYCIKSQQRRYLVSNGAEPPLMKFLERDVQVLEQTTQTAYQQVRRGSNLVEEDVPPLYALVSFTAVLLMGIQDRALDKRTEEMVRRIAANGSQLAVLVRELILRFA